MRAPGQAARPRHRHRPGHRRGRPGLRHCLRTGRGAARRVRQPPRITLPGLLGLYKARRPAAGARGPDRRQGRPRIGRCPPVRVRHADRPVVRPGPRPPHARQDRAALPSPPRRQRPPLPARPRHLLPGPPRRARPPARPADVPATATTTRPPCCSTCTPPPCGAGSPPTCPGTWPGSPGVTGKRLRAELRIRYVKVAEYQARGVIHFHAVIRLDASTKDGLHPAPGPVHRRAACATPSPWPPRAVRLDACPAPAARASGSASAANSTAGPSGGSQFAASGSALDRRRGGELHRQVRHQGRRRARPARHPHPARRRDRARCAARPTTSAWWRPPGISARGPRPVIRGCGCGRTSSATAATSSPSPAATPSPSATSGANASPTPPARAPPATANATRGAAPSTTRVVLVLADWTYAGTGYTPRTPGAELALASADMARAR